MDSSFAKERPLSQAPFVSELETSRRPSTFDIDITARCNNNCRHCYINLPAADKQARERELTLEEICDIADQATALGAVWCLVSGGEPLLRVDFSRIYLCLKRKGLVISLFTNATLVREEHIDLLKRYPPRVIEVSVYGVTKETYEAVTRVPGSFAAFMRGTDLLLNAGLPVRFKAMALKSNFHEFHEISQFCRDRTLDYFRFDPWLHLRYDGDPMRNDEIKSERLSVSEFMTAETGDSERYDALAEVCEEWVMEEDANDENYYVMRCGAGKLKFSISYDGMFRLCSSLHHPDCICDLRTTSLSEALRWLVPKVRAMASSRELFVRKCCKCTLFNFCLWCPAHAHLETGHMDMPVDYFCQIAHARARQFGVGPDVELARLID